MTELQKRIDTAYRLISSLPVSGDAVDVISLARHHLGEAYELAETEAPEEGEEDHGG